MENQTTFNWPPLESDPNIFSDYMKKIGLPSNYEYAELFSLDEEMLNMIETPVMAVIVNYERGKKQIEHNSNKFKNFEDLFYMKQIKELDDACGVIAAIHSIAANLKEIKLEDKSILSKYLTEVFSKNPVERAEILNKFKEFKESHSEFASKGQSRQCENQEEVKNHFVCFVLYEDKVVELDGILEGPKVIRESVKKEEFLFKVAEEIKNRLDSQNITENLSMIYLTKSD